MDKPGKLYNDLKVIEYDIFDDNVNAQCNKPLDPRAGSVSVEIKFNAKDVAKLLNKYITKIDCARNCKIELTQLLRYYIRLGEGMLPHKPKDLKLNRQVLNKKRNKNLSKMVKDSFKKFKMMNSKLKKNNREVIYNYKSITNLEKMDKIIIVKHGKFGKSIWKVSQFDEYDALKENFSLNESWTVSDGTKDDGVANNN